MRIATGQIYAQQILAIDNHEAQYAQYAADLSSGYMVNAPSDAPTQIAQDLQVRVSIDTETQQSTNYKSAVTQLTQTDSTLSSLTSLLQGVITNAQTGASSFQTLAQTKAIGTQVDQALQQAISLANTQYAGQYIFAGTATSANPPIVPQGSPVNGVVFNGNEQTQGQLVYNNTSFPLSTTMQQAFGYSTATGVTDAGSTSSPDVFQALINLRDTLNNQTAVDASTAGINAPGTPVYSNTPLYTGATPNAAFATLPQADSSGGFSLSITGTVNGVSSTQTVTIPETGTMSSLVTAINAVTGSTGVTASFDQTTGKISLTGSGNFSVTDTPTPAGALGGGLPATTATNAGNLTSVLNLQSNNNSGQVDFVENLTTQIGTLNGLLNQVLGARASVGASIQTLSAIGSQLASTITDNTSIQSSIEDTPVALYTTKATQAQVALTAAFQVTNTLESKTLMDYMTNL